MSERNVIHEIFRSKHSVFTAPDARMYTSLNLYIMSIQPANKAVEHQIIRMTSIGKENRSSQCLSHKEL